MKKLYAGLLFGILAATIDVTPMILQNLPWDASISAFTFWVVVGFIIATSNLLLPSWQKGIFLSLTTLMPTAILIGFKSPIHLIPILGITILLGACLGVAIERWGKE